MWSGCILLRTTTSPIFQRRLKTSRKTWKQRKNPQSDGRRRKLFQALIPRFERDDMVQ
ncbi:hypothetical protein ANANG_G00142140 [Anguilla anguilla]|uniref:Uncharacterized protein n=1 Tax=Anguilla anguilla TaxID=7936 RepID=A0A0E9X8P0_ANGAN|nr:hypothetical protein ANANG_G00142140 [Anguilla anguilla]